jgi:hypothetical protein
MAYYYNIPDEPSIKKVSIAKVKYDENDPNSRKEEVVFDILSEEHGKNMLVGLHLVEDIFSPLMHGTLVLSEPLALYDTFNFNGEEVVILELQTPGKEPTTINLEFCVHSTGRNGNLSMPNGSYKFPSINNEISIIINFISCEYNILNNVEIEMTDSDFIGKIASGDDDDDDGLVNLISKKYFSKSDSFEIEPTSNSIWFKKETKMYPWGKPEEYNQSVIQTLINLTENAVPRDNTYAPNYLFWKTTEGWNFKTIEKLLNEEEKKTFSPTGIEDSNPNEAQSILSFEVIQDNETLSLVEDGILHSYYDYVTPNYNDPYMDYIDMTDSLTTERIELDYLEAFGKWKTVEEYPLITEDYMKTLNRKVKFGDSIYGYFSPEYNRPITFYHDKYGETAKRNDAKQWQCVFDQTELEHKTLKTIQKEIKEPTKENKDKYRKQMNLKSKWDIYENRICCEKKPIIKHQFLAVIEEAKILPIESLAGTRGGIYEYTWREVEIWPKDYIDDYEIPDGEELELISREESPLSIVIIPKGLSGSYREENDVEWSNPAYNINELMNGSTGSPEVPAGETGDVFVGPGVNVISDKLNSYPKAYQMMPVGGYFRIEDDPCEINHDDIEVYFHKHVVQMYKLPSYILENTKPKEEEEDTPDPSIPKDIYFFDVPNAHDGLCRCR